MERLTTSDLSQAVEQEETCELMAQLACSVCMPGTTAVNSPVPTSGPESQAQLLSRACHTAAWHVVAAMEQHKQNAGVQGAGCKALSEIAAALNKQKLQPESAPLRRCVDTVLTAMSTHPTKGDLQEQGCRALAALAAGCPVRLQADDSPLGSGKRRRGIAAVAFAMQTHPSLGMEEAGCRALSLLAAGMESSVQDIQGCMGVLLAAMRKHPDQSKIQFCCCTFLAAVCTENAPVSLLATQSGAIELLVAAMVAFPEMHSLQLAGCEALYALTKPSQQDRKLQDGGRRASDSSTNDVVCLPSGVLAARCGGAGAVVKAMTSALPYDPCTPCHRNLLVQACMCLCHMATSEECPAWMDEAGTTIEALISIMGAEGIADDVDVQQCCCKALRAILDAHPHLIDLVCERGGAAAVGHALTTIMAANMRATQACFRVVPDAACAVLARVAKRQEGAECQWLDHHPDVILAVWSAMMQPEIFRGHCESHLRALVEAGCRLMHCISAQARESYCTLENWAALGTRVQKLGIASTGMLSASRHALNTLERQTKALGRWPTTAPDAGLAK